MITLGIETSCDETALALIETRGEGDSFECRIISSLIHSQAELHSAYGGVFPMLAKREHAKHLVPLLEKLLKESDLPAHASHLLSDEKFATVIDSFKAELEAKDPDLFKAIKRAEFLGIIPRIDQIAVTEGPGLEPTLWVGINFAKVLGALWNVPIIPVNHMEGHVVASLLETDTADTTGRKLKPLPLPSLALLISGGHTELVKVNSIGDYEIIGHTIDDAVGEAFDKAARILGLPYPGGPHISKLASEAIEQSIPSPVTLPRPMINSNDLNFSFSGLKTAVLYARRDEARKDNGNVSDTFTKGLAYEFECAVAETLETKLKKALDQTGARSLIIGGGVSANRMLRERFTSIAQEYSIPLFLPSTHTSGDNALMIALAGAIHGKTGEREIRAHGTKKLGS